jgi:alkaline phosphatase D
MDAIPHPFDRRSFLRGGLVTAGGLAAGALVGKAPGAGAAERGSFALLLDRPQVAHGVQSGDVRPGRAVIWARADRPASMFIELSNRDSFTNGRKVFGPTATAGTDFTAQQVVRGLPSGQTMSYRVSFVDVDSGRSSEPVQGSFVTPAATPHRDVTFVFTGDNAGQGWGIDTSRGGMRGWETMRGWAPEFLIHSGDTVYADGPLQPSVALPDGTTWHNLVTPEKSKVAETLDEFRGVFRYNLLDDNVRRFNAEVPILVQYDDHEVANNWYPGEVLDYRPEYTIENRVDVLAPRARQAFHEYFPVGETVEQMGRVYRRIPRGPLLDVFMLDMRTFRGPNTGDNQTSPGTDTAFLGATQVSWLIDQLRGSTATWKVIAADMPLSLVVGDSPGTLFEAVAQGDGGSPGGRELEIAGLLAAIRGVRNVVWVTADVHYCAAHYYDPSKAKFQDFDPFWEFVAGPIHAGTFGPNALDTTFGPTVVFQKPAQYPNMEPSRGFQFFGHVTIDNKGERFTVRLVDIDNNVLFSKELFAT